MMWQNMMWQVNFKGEPTNLEPVIATIQTAPLLIYWIFKAEFVAYF